MKKKIRALARKRLNSLPAAIVEKKSLFILENLQQTNIIDNAESIAIYSALPYEVQTKDLINFLLKKNKSVFAPRVMSGELVFYKIESFADLKTGFLNILEPPISEFFAHSLDLVILPCIAADTQGNRIGQGMGLYDKFLQKNNVTYKICLAFEEQVVKNFTAEIHDIPVDLIVTESRSILTEKNKISKLINGNDAANLLLLQTRYSIRKNNLNITLAIILVGQHGPSQIYVKRKIAACHSIGVEIKLHALSEKIAIEDLFNLINKLNKDESITGILIQLPLPLHLSHFSQKFLDFIDPNKDIDGLGKHQKNLLLAGNELLASCTPKGILFLLEALNISAFKKKTICLVGHGELVNKPLAIMLKNRGFTPIICDKSTQNLKVVTKTADILISATGVPKLLTSEHLKPGSIVIDAGISEIGGKISGDCETQNMLPLVKYITPVPGGIGPITIAVLTQNLLNAWQLQYPAALLQSKITSIAILTSINSWFLPYAQSLKQQLADRFNVALYSHPNQILDTYDVIFALSYLNPLPNNFIQQHGCCLVAHGSKLPAVRGWAPLSWQILNNKKNIAVSLITATEDQTSGDIVLTESIKLSGSELYKELRQKQALATKKLCLKFLEKFPTNSIFKTTKQIGAASIYRKRTADDSEIDINKSLKKQFNQLRIADNQNFPAFFYYKKKKFIIKIFEAKKK